MLRTIWSLLTIFILLTAIHFFNSCSNQTVIHTGPVNMDLSAIPYPSLSDYGFFTGIIQHQSPNEGVLPYDLNTPLFSDYAYKSRFVWMPESTTAEVDSMGMFTFPNGATLIKTFYYPQDFRNPSHRIDLVETRLLIKNKGVWHAYDYVWNNDQTDAQLNLIGDIKSVTWIDKAGTKQNIDYIVPNKNQCKSCHNRNNEIKPIGPKVANLNRNLTYPEGAKNQLSKWVEMGYLKLDVPHPQLPSVANWEDPTSGTLEARALAYLDINCGHCHHPQGPAHTTGLYLQATQTQKGMLGVCKPPVAAGKGSGGRMYGIKPGQPDSSILVFRMEDTDPGIMMPELGRIVPHQEGIQLIREWINQMDDDCQ